MTSMIRGRLALALLGTVFATSLGFANDAFAARRHVSLKKSSPAAHDTLATPPGNIQLWFSERVELATSSVKLTSASGALVPTGKITGQDSVAAPVVAPVLGTMAPGAYKVEWAAGSKDGHPVKGAFTFVIKAAR